MSLWLLFFISRKGISIGLKIIALNYFFFLILLNFREICCTKQLNIRMCKSDCLHVAEQCRRIFFIVCKFFRTYNFVFQIIYWITLDFIESLVEMTVPFLPKWNCEFNLNPLFFVECMRIGIVIFLNHITYLQRNSPILLCSRCLIFAQLNREQLFLCPFL